jgi:uncharacterized membrane protein YbaN (DUF454 family)
MRQKARRWIKLFLGWTFLVLGVLGLFLPILQGVLFLAIGFSILAQEQPWAQRLIDRVRHRWPRAAKVFDDARVKAEAWVHRVTRRRPKEQTPPRS